MKKIISAFILLALVSCTGHSPGGEKAQEEARLKRELQQKDSLLNDVFASLNQISENLTQIKDREGIVTASISREIGKEQRAQINEDIAAINALLEQNRYSLDRLKGTTEELRRANIKLGELEALVANFAKQIQDKNSDIAMLRDELSDMHIQVAELNTEVENLHSDLSGLTEEKEGLEATVAGQEETLNQVYYIVGRERDLRADNIIDKSGFIGRTVTMSGQNDLGKFTRIDRRELDRVLVGQRRATIVTSHPADSYRLEQGSDNYLEAIVITDPERFWEASRVLVVSYK